MTFDANAGVFSAGTFTVTYRPGSVSICDDNGNSCKPVTGQIAVLVTTGAIGNAPVFDIEVVGGGHLTFAAPGARLSTSFWASDWKSILASGGHVGLVYAPTLGAAYEPRAPKSHFNPQTGELWRWVRHFSGYVGSAGPCDPNADPTCAPSADAGQ